MSIFWKGVQITLKVPSLFNNVMIADIETEICVVGGGPAGSAIARQLALLGHQVCLVEKAAFPRSHIGESLPHSILPVLNLLGLQHLVESAGFNRPQQALVHWSTDMPVKKSYEQAPGFMVDRGRFDQLLLEAAQAAGVKVLQPALAGRPISQGVRQWCIPIRSDGQSMTLKTQFIVNAAGKHSPFCRSDQQHTVTTIALYGYWQKTPFPLGESYVEAGANEWFWGAALPDGKFNATIFLDAKRYAALRSQNRESWYRSLLAKTTFLNRCLEGLLTSSVKICDASFYLAEDPIGNDWIKVGEAAFAIDPLSAQGVQMALLSAFQGGVAVHTLLTQPQKTDAVFTFYRHKLQETVTRSKAAAAAFYASQNIYPQSAFWQQRSRPPAIHQPTNWEQNTRLFELSDFVRLSTAAKVIDTPVMQNNSIQLIPALHHPGLESPVGYLGHIEIASLLNLVMPSQTVLDLMRLWQGRCDLSICWQVLQWCWEHHILVAETPSNSRTAPQKLQIHA